MTHHLRLAVAALAVVGLAACSSKPAPAPAAAPSAVRTGGGVTTATASAQPTPFGGGTATADPSATALPQARVTSIKVTENGPSIQVSGVLLGPDGRPVVGAVGDFFIEGSPQNLVQSYATKVDGSFSSTFTTKELAPEATLMMHYRGDSTTAPGTFLLRRGTGTPRPSDAPATTARPTPAPASSAPVPAPAASPRPVAITDPDGGGTPRATLTGPRAHVEGRLITPADGHPVRGTQVTWRAGSASGQAQTATDGAFAFDADLPAGTRQIVIAYAGTNDRSPATVTVTV